MTRDEERELLESGLRVIAISERLSLNGGQLYPDDREWIAKHKLRLQGRCSELGIVVVVREAAEAARLNA